MIKEKQMLSHITRRLSIFSIVLDNLVPVNIMTIIKVTVNKLSESFCFFYFLIHFCPDLSLFLYQGRVGVGYICL